jgi:hypothetical protein
MIVPEIRTYLHGRSKRSISPQLSFLIWRGWRYQEQQASTCRRRSRQRRRVERQRRNMMWASKSRRGTCCIGPLSSFCTSSCTPRRILWMQPSGWKGGTPIHITWVIQSTIIGHSKNYYRSLKEPLWVTQTIDRPRDQAARASSSSLGKRASRAALRQSPPQAPLLHRPEASQSPI